MSEIADGEYTQMESLFDEEAFLKNLDADERRIQLLTRKGQLPSSYSAPIGVQFELTGRCNQRCPQCYNNSRLSENQADKELSTAEWCAIAGSVCDLGVMQLVLSGGEPLLLKDGLFEIMDVIASRNISMVLITNGMLVSRETVSRLAKYSYHWIQVSVDGSTPEEYREMRGVDGWERAMAACWHLSAQGLPLRIAHTITRKNIANLGKMIELAYLVGAVSVHLSPLIPTGGANGLYDDLCCTPAELRKAWESASGVISKLEGQMVVLVSPFAYTGLRQRLYKPNKVVVIRPDGSVRLGCIEPFLLGNIRTESLEEIWARIGRHVHSNHQFRTYAQAVVEARSLLSVKPVAYVDDPIDLSTAASQTL